MRGECASEEDSGCLWGRGKAITKRIGWVVVRELHVLEVGPREGGAGLLGGALEGRRNLACGRGFHGGGPDRCEGE